MHLREVSKYEVFLVRIFLHSDWILSVFGHFPRSDGINRQEACREIHCYGNEWIM